MEGSSLGRSLPGHVGRVYDPTQTSSFFRDRGRTGATDLSR